MSIINLDIDDSLKSRLDFLLNEFESYRVSNTKIAAVATPSPAPTIKIEEKKSSFFQKFFFSDF